MYQNFFFIYLFIFNLDKDHEQVQINSASSQTSGKYDFNKIYHLAFEARHLETFNLHTLGRISANKGIW